MGFCENGPRHRETGSFPTDDNRPGKMHMKRRRLLWNAAILFGFLAIVGTVLGVMVKHVPRFYRDAETVPGEARKKAYVEALSIYERFLNRFADDEPTWQARFSAEQINNALAEDTQSLIGENMPEAFSDPRVQIENGMLRIGIRYGRGIWSSILVLDLRIWLVPGESNLIALEIVNLQAGSLPLSTSTLLDYISETVRHYNFDISWYRQEGHPVAIIKLQAAASRTTFQLMQLEFKDSKITLVGRSTDQTVPTLPKSTPK
jgi:hypothetical protein